MTGIIPESRKQIIITHTRSQFKLDYDRFPLNDEIFDTLEEHVATHKYLLDGQYGVDVSISAAFTNWVEYVMEPLMFELHKANAVATYKRHPLHLFVALSDAWHTEKKDGSPYDPKHMQAAIKMLDGE